MPASFVQCNLGYSQSSPIAVAFVSSNTSGNCLVVDIAIADYIGTTIVTISDTNSNVYSLISNTQLSGYRLISYVAPNCGSGANSVFVASSVPGSNFEVIVAIHEYSGIYTSSPLDVYSQNQSYSFAPGDVWSASITTTSADLLHFSALWVYQANVTDTNGWNARTAYDPYGSGQYLAFRSYDSTNNLIGVVTEGEQNIDVTLSSNIQVLLLGLKVTPTFSPAASAGISITSGVSASLPLFPAASNGITIASGGTPQLLIGAPVGNTASFTLKGLNVYGKSLYPMRASGTQTT